MSFIPAGAIEQIVWPTTTSYRWDNWGKADELWRHTCFEAFGMLDGEQGYFETNFATSCQWAAYGFYDYREGMHEACDIELIRADWRLRERQAELHASLRVPQVYWDKPWRVGLSAVIEAKNGTKSYWALSHPPGKPDFHHPDSFTLELPPPEFSYAIRN